MTPGLAAFVAFSFELLVETGKCFAPGEFPDFYEAIPAAIAAGLTVKAMPSIWRLFEMPVDPVRISGKCGNRHRRFTYATRTIPARSQSMSSRMFQSGSVALRTVITGLCFIIAGLGLLLYPVMPTVLAAALIVYGVVLWRWPSAWLIVLPALFPVLDLTPWTGWLLVGEYHLFSLITVGVLILRAPPSADDIRPSGLGGVATMLALLACLVSVAIGLSSPLPLPSSSDLIYLEPMNALRLAGGFGLALSLFPFMRERQRSGCPVVQILGTGMAVGLVLVAVAVIVERALFPGLFNFQEDYRVVASFSSMHLGRGAYRCLLGLRLAISLCMSFSARGRLHLSRCSS